MTPQATTTIEYRAVSDEETVLRNAFADARTELNLIPEPARSQLLELQFTAQQRQYRVAYPKATDRVILCDGQPAGRLLVDFGPSEMVLVDIAILQAYQRRGIGSAVVASLCDEADAQLKPIRLRAIATVPGLTRWYGRFGFIQVEASGAHLVLVRTPQLEGGTA